MLNILKKKIVVLCANDKSVIEEKFKKILSKVGVELEEEYDVYYVGKTLTEELPFRLQRSLDELEFEDVSIVINEHCPYFIFSSKIKYDISKMLISGGIFVTLDYSRDEVSFEDSCYVNHKSEDLYIVYRKL